MNEVIVTQKDLFSLEKIILVFSLPHLFVKNYLIPASHSLALISLMSWLYPLSSIIGFSSTSSEHI